MPIALQLSFLLANIVEILRYGRDSAGAGQRAVPYRRQFGGSLSFAAAQATPPVSLTVQSGWTPLGVYAPDSVGSEIVKPAAHHLHVFIAPKRAPVCPAF